MEKLIKYSHQELQQVKAARQVIEEIKNSTPAVLAQLKTAVQAPLDDRHRFQLNFLAQSLLGVEKTCEELDAQIAQAEEQLRLATLPPAPGAKSFCDVCGGHAIFMAGTCCEPSPQT